MISLIPFDAVDWVFCVEGTTPSGGGGGGGGGGGPSGGGNSNNGPGSVTEIIDSEVPLSPWTGEDGSIVILDSGVPLANIPRMGDTGISGYIFGILLALLIAAGALYMKKRYSVQKQ